jgi:hypothetical protein
MFIRVSNMSADEQHVYKTLLHNVTGGGCGESVKRGDSKAMAWKFLGAMLGETTFNGLVNEMMRSMAEFDPSGGCCHSPGSNFIEVNGLDGESWIMRVDAGANRRPLVTLKSVRNNIGSVSIPILVFTTMMRKFHSELVSQCTAIVVDGAVTRQVFPVELGFSGTMTRLSESQAAHMRSHLEWSKNGERALESVLGRLEKIESQYIALAVFFVAAEQHRETAALRRLAARAVEEFSDDLPRLFELAKGRPELVEAAINSLARDDKETIDYEHERKGLLKQAMDRWEAKYPDTALVLGYLVSECLPTKAINRSAKAVTRSAQAARRMVPKRPSAKSFKRLIPKCLRKRGKKVCDDSSTVRTDCARSDPFDVNPIKGDVISYRLKLQQPATNPIVVEFALPTDGGSEKGDSMWLSPTMAEF